MFVSGRELPVQTGNLAICFAILVSFTCSAVANDHVSRDAVIRDLDALRYVLIESHIAPFAYSSATAVNDAFSLARDSLGEETLSMVDAYRALQRGASALKNGHTSVGFSV